MIIRKAQRGDEFAILELIKGLADFENEPDEVVNTAEKLGADLFDRGLCEALVIAFPERIIGFALYYTAYSTWKGPVLYLEDLYVLPEYRGTGAGSKLFDTVVSIADERNCARMDWQVLDWNTDAIAFYERKGAVIDKEWYNGRMFFPENEPK
ncbi:GNAT family N-acetyltransferase [Crocinitomicaceae bacterium]|nr:GNAT family N-acetyltransferase [Crocinitomicaceae bacterium]MDB3906900.1 GNAT family N-acetyltransferase [Crocinitomicaceae bacterium]